jgi:hypothetical protein
MKQFFPRLYVANVVSLFEYSVVVGWCADVSEIMAVFIFNAKPEFNYRSDKIGDWI